MRLDLHGQAGAEELQEGASMNPVVKYLWNQAISVDQLFNTIFGGDPDEVYSSRLGKLQTAHGGRIPWYRPIPKFIAWGLDNIQKDHCKKSIEADEGNDAVLDTFAEHHWHDANKGGK
jgi:hypothetical protein